MSANVDLKIVQLHPTRGIVYHAPLFTVKWTLALPGDTQDSLGLCRSIGSFPTGGCVSLIQSAAFLEKSLWLGGQTKFDPGALTGINPPRQIGNVQTLQDRAPRLSLLGLIFSFLLSPEYRQPNWYFHSCGQYVDLFHRSKPTCSHFVSRLMTKS